MSLSRFAPVLLLSLSLTSSASAGVLSIASGLIGFQHGGGGHGGGGGSAPMMTHGYHGYHNGQGNFPGAGNVVHYNPIISGGYGIGVGYSPFFFVGAGGGWGPPGFSGFAPPLPTGLAVGFADGVGAPGGLMLPSPPRNGPQARPRPPNPARSKELVELGDRAFRGGNTKKAEERYLLAIKADPTSVVPHVHLAQLAMTRGKYRDAAESLRAAVAIGAGSGWLANAPDVQAIFSEPGDFARQLARLETHLQANPSDRDAWFVLGAEQYLSGRARQAADVFQRLTDRQPDEALAAFLEVASPPKPDTR